MTRTSNALPAAHRFITIEGGEGVGKSSALQHLNAVLRGLQIKDYVITREPGGTPLGESVRDILLRQRQGEPITDAAELLLLFAARAQHVSQVIRPALERGAFVICDRFVDSTYAYQGAAEATAPDTIAQLEARFVGFRPGLTLLLDAPVEVSRQRLANRAALDRIESRTDAYFNAVREAFLRRAESEPDRIKVIRAERSPQLVQWQVQACLLEYLSSIETKPLLD